MICLIKNTVSLSALWFAIVLTVLLSSIFKVAELKLAFAFKRMINQSVSVQHKFKNFSSG